MVRIERSCSSTQGPNRIAPSSAQGPKCIAPARVKTLIVFMTCVSHTLTHSSTGLTPAEVRTPVMNKQIYSNKVQIERMKHRCNNFGDSLNFFFPRVMSHHLQVRTDHDFDVEAYLLFIKSDSPYVSHM